MSIYKKGINKLEQCKDIEFTMSNNCGVYMNLTVIGENSSPYHGLFIKQDEENDEIYLSKLIEQIKIGSKTYYIKDIVTNEEKYGGAEYLEEFDRYPVPIMRYNIENEINMEKRYIFDVQSNVLCVDYTIENLSKTNSNIKILPLTTKRGLFTTKRESMLKFNTDHLSDGVKVTLSITQNKFLYLKSLDAKFKQKPHYINGIKYSYKVTKDEEKMYIEDVYVPGYFEFNVKANSKQNIQIYISCDNINIEDEIYSVSNLYNKQVEKNKMLTVGIEESFFELKSLAMTASELSYIDKIDKKFILLKSLPNIQNKSEYLKHIIKSIEGNYILLNKFKEAYKILQGIKYRLENEKENYNKLEYYETLLVYIEALNKYANSDKALKSEKQEIYSYIKEKIDEILNLNNENRIIDDSYIVNIENKRYLLINIYWYNALRIYLNITNDNINKIYEITEKLKDNLIDTFFDDTAKVLKYEASEEAYANSDMLFAMDLTYPLIYDKISMKVIDTAFKELYTPYGIRKFAINSDKYDGYVYPHLMTTFVNSNLRQNGVTRATQKISYNLVKELLAEINKETVGTVKYKYDEKTKKAYGMPVNALTNAELIRLYNMLT